MKKLLVLFVLSVSFLFSGCASLNSLIPKEKKVLSIGNSFSWSVRDDLKAIAAADGNAKLLLEFAYRGGCTMKKHWEMHLKSQKEPSYKPYEKKYSLVDKLRKEKWDIVVIQQASHESWKVQSYQPWADNLITLIRKHAPQAEIVIQQTWSYRCDDPRIIVPGGTWKFGQKEMYDRLTKNYIALAKKYKFQVIPSGYAVQLYRQQEKNPFKPLSKKQLASYKPLQEIPYAGDVVGKHYWRTDKKNGTHSIGCDTIHLNEQGRYLQACVWYYTIFGNRNIKYVPECISPEKAKLYQSIAGRAVKDFPQTDR